MKVDLDNPTTSAEIFEAYAQRKISLDDALDRLEARRPKSATERLAEKIRMAANIVFWSILAVSALVLVLRACRGGS